MSELNQVATGVVSRLVPGMYGNEFEPKRGLFGLACGQRRGSEIIANAGWYNQAGQKIGWGDLDKVDLKHIVSELKEGEAFFVLSQQDSQRGYEHNRAELAKKINSEPSSVSGIDYANAYAQVVMFKGEAYYIFRKSLESGIPETVNLRGVVFKTIKP